MDESSSQQSKPGDQDDDPDIRGTTKAEMKQPKGRVRIMSRAAEQPTIPPASASTNTPHARSLSNSRVVPTSILRVREPSIAEQHIPEDTAALSAQIRGNNLANIVQTDSSVASRSSLESYGGSDAGDSHFGLLEDQQDIALQPLAPKETRRGSQAAKFSSDLDRSAHNHVTHSNSGMTFNMPADASTSQLDETNDGAPTSSGINRTDTKTLQEIYNGAFDGSYHVPAPEQYRGGVLSQLLKLSRMPDIDSFREKMSKLPDMDGFREKMSPKHGSPKHSRPASGIGTGTTTPERRKWYEQNVPQDTLATLIGASRTLAKPAQPQGNDPTDRKAQRPKHKREMSLSERFNAFLRQEESEARTHIAGILQTQTFIIKICEALMLYGAPTHRLEEYLMMTARALRIEAQFLYIPGCMIISFDDKETHTTEVKLVRLAQGIDLGRLKDTHHIYKEVIHDMIGVEEAMVRLEALTAKPNKFHPWFRVLVFGLTSVTAAPFSFKARAIDLPLCFAFGCLVGFLQLIIAPMSPLYSNVFEVCATVIVSFLARAFGTLKGGDLFCFSALAQGGVVMLLPGYIFLSSSLELQARAIVPGSIRIIYGVIYSLLLGFGITIGSVVYGMIDQNATSSISCPSPNLSGLYGFPFVPPFVLCISILYQAKWQQMPVMVTVAFAGYVVNYYSSLRFVSSPQIAGTLGAFAVGTMANLYSRFRHGVAAAILVPAIFTQVPGSLATQGGLLSGLQVANAVNNATNGTIMDQSAYASITGGAPSSIVFGVASSMIQIAIGITVGLFLSAVVVYPLGKKKSGLFSF